MTDPRFLPGQIPPPYRGLPEVPAASHRGPRIARVKLIAEWETGKDSSGYRVDWGQDTHDATFGVSSAEAAEFALYLRDPCNLVPGTLPLDSYVTVWQPEDAWDGHWEILVSSLKSYGGLFGDGTTTNDNDPAIWTPVDFGSTDQEHTPDIIMVAAGVLSVDKPGIYRIRGDLTVTNVDTGVSSYIEMRLAAYSGPLFGRQLGGIMQGHAHGTTPGYIGITTNAELIGEELVRIEFRGDGGGADVQATYISLTVNQA